MARKAADDRIGPYMPRPGPVVRVLVARVIEAEQIEGRILTAAGMISIGHNAAGLAAGPGCVYRMQPRDGLSGCVQHSRYDALDSGSQFVEVAGPECVCVAPTQSITPGSVLAARIRTSRSRNACISSKSQMTRTRGRACVVAALRARAWA